MTLSVIDPEPIVFAASPALSVLALRAIGTCTTAMTTETSTKSFPIGESWPAALRRSFNTEQKQMHMSDAIGTLASPFATLPSTGDPAADARNVIDLADHEDVEAFVVGLPLNMDGSEGPQAKTCRAFAASGEPLRVVSGGTSAGAGPGRAVVRSPISPVTDSLPGATR